jgi:hypothetical protein
MVISGKSMLPVESTDLLVEIPEYCDSGFAGSFRYRQIHLPPANVKMVRLFNGDLNAIHQGIR